MAHPSWIEMLCCPVCQGSFHLEARSIRCEKKHSFDFAREGYLHLLPSGQARRGIGGDTLPMLQARRRFLESGAYAPLAAALLAQFPPSKPPEKEQVVVDVGCGEGYYTAAISNHIKSTCCVGVDVSREAVRLASRRRTMSAAEGPHFVVADGKLTLPLHAGVVDVVVGVFAPRNPGEFARVLAPRGLLLIAIPNAGHLHELRARFGGIGIEVDKQAHLSTQLAPFFEADGEVVWEQTLQLSATAVHDLLHMTPQHHHVAVDAGSESLAVSASVRVLRFRKRIGAGVRGAAAESRR